MSDKSKKKDLLDRSVNLNVRIPQEMLEGLRGLAKKMGETPSTVVRTVLREHLTAVGVKITT